MCTGVFFFFKQKTAYEMRISDWSSDVCSSDLYDHHHRLVVVLSDHRECRRVTLAETGQPFDRPFDVLRPDVPAIGDDQVLAAPGDDELAVDRVAEIARIEPTVGRKRGIGGLLVPKISRHQARPADQDAPDLTIAEIVAAVSGNAEFVPRHANSADDDGTAILASFGTDRNRFTRRRQRLANNRV